MEPLTRLSQMDARWYEAETARFIQPDQYNIANLVLPPGAQSELLRYIGKSQSDLLRDPAQQMQYGYVSRNPFVWIDPLGLCGTSKEEINIYTDPYFSDPNLQNDIYHYDMSEQDAVKLSIGAALDIPQSELENIEIKEDSLTVNVVSAVASLFGQPVDAVTTSGTIHLNTSDTLNADNFYSLDNLGFATHEVHHVQNQWGEEDMSVLDYLTASDPENGEDSWYGNNQYEIEAETIGTHYGVVGTNLAEELM